MVRFANDWGQETEDRGKETGKNPAAGALHRGLRKALPLGSDDNAVLYIEGG